MDLVAKAIKKAGGQTKLASQFRDHGYKTVRQSHVYKWKVSKKFPPAWAEAVESVTAGDITAAQVIRAAMRKAA